jgi:hypothetical protein
MMRATKIKLDGVNSFFGCGLIGFVFSITPINRLKACPTKMQMIGNTGRRKRNSLCSENECNTIYGPMIQSNSDLGPYRIVEISQMKKGSMTPQMAGIPAYAYHKKGCVP